MPPSESLEVRRSGVTATATRTDRGWEAELVVAPDGGSGQGGEAQSSEAQSSEVQSGEPVMAELLDEVGHHGGGILRWRVAAPTEAQRAIAESQGFSGDRRLFQLRRDLPLPVTTDLATRAFDSNVDTEPWLRVNNAAFAWHPEQSGQTIDDLLQTMAEPWFDPEGFLVHPVTGPMKGFCWTKVHNDFDPPMGEIFVIGVHPDHHGEGLGKALVLAGLDHLAQRGLRRAMLYTEADNIPALRMYEGLGFEVDHEIVVFERDIQPS